MQETTYSTMQYQKHLFAAAGFMEVQLLTNHA